MEFPFSLDELLIHLPEGGLREDMSDMALTAPEKALDLTVRYYAADEEGRADIRAFYYSMETGESWNKNEAGPTSLELHEQIEPVSDLPAHLVEAARTFLKSL